MTADGEPEPLRTPIPDGPEAANRKILELGVGAVTTLAAVRIEGGLAGTLTAKLSTLAALAQEGRPQRLASPTI